MGRYDRGLSWQETREGCRWGPTRRTLELGTVRHLSWLFSREHHSRNAVGCSDEERTAPNQGRQEHSTAKELAGRKHPQTRINLFPEGTAHPGLRQRIRSIWAGWLSREQVPCNELNRSAQINTKMPTKQPSELFRVLDRSLDL